MSVCDVPASAQIPVSYTNVASPSNTRAVPASAQIPVSYTKQYAICPSGGVPASAQIPVSYTLVRFMVRASSVPASAQIPVSYTLGRKAYHRRFSSGQCTNPSQLHFAAFATVISLTFRPVHKSQSATLQTATVNITAKFRPVHKSQSATLLMMVSGCQCCSGQCTNPSQLHSR